MTVAVISFGPGAWVVVGIYLLSLVGIGMLSYRTRQENSLRDFYLAGRGFGFIVLLLTLYATQYSGNTVVGFPGKAYQSGFSWIMSVHFATATVVFYLLFAPKLRAMARRKGFITPVDYLDDRFKSTGINVVAAVVMIVVLSNYLLAQLRAMGSTLEGLTEAQTEEGRRAAFVFGVIFLALIVVVYETLGGLRAVAWTDMIQGVVLLFGIGMLLIISTVTVFPSVGVGK